MSVMTVGDWTKAPRRRWLADDIAVAAPAALVMVAIGWRLGGGVGAVIALAVAAVPGLAIARRRARRFDRAWLTAALDARRADLEDSSDLLFRDDAGLSPLQRLQRSRLRHRLDRAPLPDLRAPWSVHRIAIGWILCLIAVAAVLLTGGDGDAGTLAPAAEGLPAVPGVPRLVGQQLMVVPPAYTGLPTRRLGTLDAQVPQGARLVWRLRFAPAARAVSLGIVGQRPQPLAAPTGDWAGARVADRSMLYRVLARGAERQVPPLHRIDVIADQPPRIRIVAPGQTLTMATPGQRIWAPAFAVSDDYGVAPVARLRIVLAQGEGENVSFRERIVPVTGAGGGRSRRFRAGIDLAGAGFTEPGDLVVQLIVRDNRAPTPHEVRGPSLILRRASPAGAGSSGLEASVKRALPAYFTSQRQIIIDATALIADRRRVPADRFLSRADAIGADQRLLRLRYGQFMGEETGGGATAAMPTNDEEEGGTAGHDDHHDHAAAPATPAFGAAMDVTAEYGHTHDESEAATLLDPGTRATLRRALDNMWQSELALRQGDPARALPYANDALRFIKQVQQATRIFLARVGTELPPVDQARRLTGKRDGIAPAGMPGLGDRPVGREPAATWAALAGGGAVDLTGLSRWMSANEARVPDALGLAAAIDAVRRSPDCGACRQRLRGLIWTILPRPAAMPARRPSADAPGRRYLEALR